MNEMTSFDEQEENILFLDKCLDQVIEDRTTTANCIAQHPEWAAELEPLLRTVEATLELDVPAMNPAAVQAIRRQVLDQAGELRRDRSSRYSGFRTMWARLASTAAIVIVVLALGLIGMWQASANSLPGHTLYPVKRTVEELRLSFTANPVEKATLHLDYALHRLDEARRLAEKEPLLSEESLRSANREINRAETELTQAETKAQPIAWDEVEELASQGEQKLSNIELSNPIAEETRLGFRRLYQRARGQSGEQPDPTHEVPETPPAEATATHRAPIQKVEPTLEATKQKPVPTAKPTIASSPVGSSSKKPVIRPTTESKGQRPTATERSALPLETPTAQPSPSGQAKGRLTETPVIPTGQAAPAMTTAPPGQEHQEGQSSEDKSNGSEGGSAQSGGSSEGGSGSDSGSQGGSGSSSSGSGSSEGGSGGSNDSGSQDGSGSGSSGGSSGDNSSGGGEGGGNKK